MPDEPRGWVCGFRVVLLDLVDFELNKAVPGASCELPNTLDGGGPAGVKEFVADGGGPAGVVEGPVLSAAKGLLFLPLCFCAGVEGGLDEKGTVNPPDMLKLG